MTVLLAALEPWDFGRAGLVLLGGVLVGILVPAVVRRFTRDEGDRTGGDPRGAAVLARLLRIVLLAVALIYALAQLGVRITPLLTAAGIGGVALAFAVKTIFENFLAGILLLLRRPFAPGDQVVSGDHEGVVEDVNLRAVVLRTYDGQRVFIPNGQVLGEPIVNRTAFDVRRSEIVVGIDYDADPARAARLLTEALRATDGILDEPAPEVYVAELGASSVNLCARFWHPSPMADAWEARHRAAIALKAACDDNDIPIPFPQMTLRPADDGAPLLVAPVRRDGQDRDDDSSGRRSSSRS